MVQRPSDFGKQGCRVKCRHLTQMVMHFCGKCKGRSVNGDHKLDGNHDRQIIDGQRPVGSLV
jgi:hypothetical protein